MKVYFRKTFKYNPVHSGLSRYESYEAVTRQNRSPDIVATKPAEHFNIRTYCSSLKRCKHTAKILSSGRITILDELREIKFSLHDLVTEGEFEKYGSEIVRERFINAFVNDTLLEKRNDIQNRIFRAIKIFTDNSADKLVVSHSFTMKMFEAILVTKINIFKNPELITNVIFPEKKTYEFGQGFEVVIKS